jgi:hypothetical protein
MCAKLPRALVRGNALRHAESLIVSPVFLPTFETPLAMERSTRRCFLFSTVGRHKRMMFRPLGRARPSLDSLC